MKKYLIIVLCSLLYVSCEKNIIGDFGGEAAAATETESNDFELSEADKLKKKGAAFSGRAQAWSHKTSQLGAHWMYSWGREIKEQVPDNVEFVPMFWGGGSVTDERLAEVKQLIDEGKVKYVLGFNEPDGVAQANMTVDEAIALWPKLEALGVPLGSPATVSPNNEWMVEFMQKAEEQNLRIDFVAVHSYGGPSVLSLINKLKDTYNAYNRPIWITEFAVADWNATSPAANKHSEAVIMDFMTETLKALDDIEWIHRYAWFDGGVDSAPLATSALFDNDVNITGVGQIYANNKPNSEIGPGQDTEFTPVIDPDEILVNGNFETGQVSPWGGFKNGVTTEGVKTGAFAGKISNGDGLLLTVAAVEAGKTYILKFASKWEEAGDNTLKPLFRNDEVSGGAGVLLRLDKVSTTDTWEETTYEFKVPEGTSNLRIVFYKTSGNPPFYLDDVSLKEKK